MTWTAYIGVGKCGKFKLDRGSVLAAVGRGYSETSVICLVVRQGKMLVMKSLRLTWGDCDRLVCMCCTLLGLNSAFTFLCRLSLASSTVEFIFL